jgi:hypothetical protein
MVYSREPIEDVLIEQIRYESFKTTFGLYFAWLIALNFTCIFSDFIFNPNPFVYLGVPLIFYNIYFNTMVILKTKLLNSHVSLCGKVNYYKKYVSVYLLLFIAIFIFIIILFLKK